MLVLFADVHAFQVSSNQLMFTCRCFVVAAGVGGCAPYPPPVLVPLPVRKMVSSKRKRRSGDTASLSIVPLPSPSLSPSLSLIHI